MFEDKEARVTKCYEWTAVKYIFNCFFIVATKLKEANTHKSAKNYTGNVFVTLYGALCKNG